jgi:hypothetical protein
VDNQNDLGCFWVNIGDYLMNDGADDTFLQPCISRLTHQSDWEPNSMQVA